MKRVLIVSEYVSADHGECTGIILPGWEIELRNKGFEIIEVCDKNNCLDKIYNDQSIVAVFIDFRERKSYYDKVKFIIDRIRANKVSQYLPIITIIHDDSNANNSISLGADDCLVWQFSCSAIVAKIKLMAELSEYRKNNK